MVIKKAIIPSCSNYNGFAHTHIMPKEMLPFIDRPVLQYVIEEAVKTGIEHCIMVQARSNTMIDEYFRPDTTFETKRMQLDYSPAQFAAQQCAKKCDFSYIYAREPQNLAHTIWTARDLASNEPTAIMLPDEVIMGQVPSIAQLIKIAIQEKCNVIAVREVPSDQVHNYGILRIKKQFSPTLFQVKELINKPTQTDAPSNLAIVGRFVLSPTIFNIINNNKDNSDLCFIDCIQQLLCEGEKVYAYKVLGTHYEMTNPLQWLKSSIAMALRHPDYADEIMNFLQTLDRDFLFMQGKAHTLGQKEKDVRF